VDLTDFTILAANFNQAGRTFPQGNFDYDAAGNVDLSDFTILAANFNNAVAASTDSVLAAAAPREARSTQTLFNAAPLRLETDTVDLLALADLDGIGIA